MYKLLWAVVFVLAWGCNQPPAQEVEQQQPSAPELALKPEDWDPRVDSKKQDLSVEDFALKPERGETSDIRADFKKYKEQIRKFAEDVKNKTDFYWPEEAKIDLSDKSVPLAKKLDGLLSELSRQQNAFSDSRLFNFPETLTEERRKAFLADIASSAPARMNDWKKEEDAWAARPKAKIFSFPTVAPSSLWNKRFIVSCAKKMHEKIKEEEAPEFSEVRNQKNRKPQPMMSPESFLKKAEEDLNQKEAWKAKRKAVWDTWVKEAPVSEQYEALESIVKKMSDLSATSARKRESDWRTYFDEGCWMATESGGERLGSWISSATRDVETLEFLQRLISSLPKPWRQTKNSFTSCEEVSGEECVKNARFVSWKEVDNGYFIRYEMTAVSCQKGFFENGDCRAGYRRVVDGAGTYKQTSCDTYFKGKCYGNFSSSEVETEMRCIPQPAWDLQIKKSDFDGSWGYYASSEGCKEDEYKLWCYRFDPRTLVCREGFYQEEGRCEMDYGISFEYFEGCTPDEDLLSCEIKDGVCVNEKIIKGRNLIRKQKKKKEFRLERPFHYAFE